MDEEDNEDTNYNNDLKLWDGSCSYNTNKKNGYFIFHKDKPDYIVMIPPIGANNDKLWHLETKINSLSKNNIPDIVVQAIASSLKKMN